MADALGGLSINVYGIFILVVHGRLFQLGLTCTVILVRTLIDGILSKRSWRVVSGDAHRIFFQERLSWSVISIRTLMASLFIRSHMEIRLFRMFGF